METLQSTIFIEFDVNTKKITFLRGDNIIDYDSNVTNIYVRVKYKNLSGNTVYLTQKELEGYKFSLYTIKPATNNINVITGKVTDELKENVYGGVVKFEIPRACTNRLGIVKCEIHINQKNKLMASSTFVLDVRQSLVTEFNDALLGDEDFPVLKKLILEIQKDSNINDNAASLITTYSSDKIETIKEDISLQIEDIIDEDVEYDSKKYNITHFKSLALKNKSNFIKKLKLNEGVKIVCRGDSLTYGEDNVVDQRAADSTLTHTGRVHTSLRANTTYPEALQEYLSLVKKVTVINQGHSGDNTMMGFEDWTTDVGADLTIIMYGTNDSAYGFSPYLALDNFIKHYEKIIIRELLRGSAVILMKPPKLKKIDGRYYTETYRQVVEELGNKYNLDVLDCAEMLINDDSSVFADYVHFKSVGYKKIASKITAFLLGNMSKPVKVKRGNTLLTREEFDSVTFDGYSTAASKIDAFTPPLDSWQGGYVAESNNDKSIFIWSFYADEDDLIMIPTLYAGRCITRFELDFGLDQPQYSLDDKVGHTTYSYQHGTTDKPVSYVEFDPGADTQAYSTREMNMKYIHITTKGWHTIKVTLKDNGSTDRNKYVCLNGISFMGYEEFVMWERMKKVDGRHFMLTHTSWSPTPSEVSTLTFKRSDILESLAWEETNNLAFKNPILDITVYSYEKGIVEYLWNLGILDDNSKSYLIQKGIYKIDSATDSDLRLIDNISYSDGVYTINFKGKLDVISSVNIKLN